MKKINFSKALYYFVLCSFMVPIAFLIYRISTVDAGVVGEGMKSRADYILMLVQCALGILVIHLPSFLGKKLKFEVPTALYIMYIIFLYCAIFLGEVQSFYYNVPHWDDILHFFSSMMTGMFGFMLISIINEDKHVAINLSPFFVSLFAFSFSMMLGGLWEIYEFTFDGVLKLNMQKFMLEDGTPLVGRAALADTMKDIIVDGCGALLASAFGFFSLKQKKGWAYTFITSKKAHKKEQSAEGNIES